MPACLFQLGHIPPKNVAPRKDLFEEGIIAIGPTFGASRASAISYFAFRPFLFFALKKKCGKNGRGSENINQYHNWGREGRKGKEIFNRDLS